MAESILFLGLTKDEVILIGGGLSFALAGAAYARLSRWRLEQANGSVPPVLPGMTRDTGARGVSTDARRRDWSEQHRRPASFPPEELRALERRLLWKLGLVTVTAQAVIGAALYAALA